MGVTVLSLHRLFFNGVEAYCTKLKSGGKEGFNTSRGSNDWRTSRKENRV